MDLAISENEARGKLLCCVILLLLSSSSLYTLHFWDRHLRLGKQYSSHQQSSCFPSWHPFLPPPSLHNQLKLSLPYWFAETDALLLSDALVWIKAISYLAFTFVTTSHYITVESVRSQCFPRWCLSITTRKALQLQLDSCSHEQPVYITPNDCNSLWSYRKMLSCAKYS